MAVPCCFRFALSAGRAVPRRNTLKICERLWHLTWRQVISQRNSQLQTWRPPLSPVGDKCLQTTPCRQMSSVITDAELKKSVEALSEKFTEAMVHLEDARHSAGTVYFSEDAKEAEEIVQDTLNDFSELLSGLDAKQQLWVKRTIGLKMEELKAQLQMLQDLARE